MPPLTPADEQLIHQIPEALPNVVTWHEHWRESYFFVAHHPDDPGDVLILTMATYPVEERLDCFQMGVIGDNHVFALHGRDYDGDPHTTVVGPVEIDIVEPYEKVTLRVDESRPNVPVGLDLTFTARSAPYGLRRGTMKWHHETVWDQSHMFQSGRYDGTYTVGGETLDVDGWWGQRDHSWGIRDHSRCPLWMWLAIQLPDGMLGVWNWEYANGARVYTDGCWAPDDGSDPVPVVGFHHDLSWTDAQGAPISYGRDGEGVVGLSGTVVFGLEGGETVTVEAEGRWAAPYGPYGGGQHQMTVRTDDGRTGTAIYEVTGAHHHHFFPVARAERLPPG